MESLPDPEVEQAIAAYFSSLSRNDRQGWLDLFADGAVSHDPVGVPPVEGKPALDEVWKAIWAPFRSLRVTPTEIFYGGSGAAVRWQAEGVGVNARSVRFCGIDVFELDRAGKIQTLMAYWDPAAMLIKLAGEPS